MTQNKTSILNRALISICILFIVVVSGCKHGPLHTGEYMYVASQQVNLRDRVAAIYNKVGTATNGERVEVLDRQKRFVRIRTSRGEEGWVELRNLADASVFKGFHKLESDNKNSPVQGRGTSRAELNMHLTAARDGDVLYQLPESSKLELLKRATSERATPQQIAAKKAAALKAEQAKAEASPLPETGAKKHGKQPNQPKVATVKPNETVQTSKPDEEAPKLYDDWWLARSKDGRVGWVLARMIDLDVPLEVAQYAEGQRILGAYVLNEVQDDEKGKVSQYLVVLNEPKDGLPYDFNQLRVFSWNTKRHRYETAYRERNIMGYFPVQVGTEDFGKDGVLPIFRVQKKNEDGTVTERKYRLIGPVVRQVYAPGEEQKKAAEAQPKSEKQKLATAKKGMRKRK